MDNLFQKYEAATEKARDVILDFGAFGGTNTLVPDTRVLCFSDSDSYSRR